jgi:hypothetical protein
MSQHVITTQTPSIPFWRRRLVVVAAFVALLAAGAGVAIGALGASDSSVTYRYRTAPAPVEPAASPLRSTTSCTAAGPDAGSSLLALVASMPDGAGTRMIASLSPQAQQLAGDAAYSAAYVSWEQAPAPDAPTLAAVLSRLPTTDSAVVLNMLAPDVSTDVAASLNNIASLPSC